VAFRTPVQRDAQPTPAAAPASPVAFQPVAFEPAAFEPVAFQPVAFDPGPPVQRELDPGAGGVGELGGDGSAATAFVPDVIQRATSSAAGGGGAGSPAGDRELDILAQNIYERVRSHLRLELLVDRERSGLLSNLS
jgi:hypothetical protein